jgi:hypothetical protein
LLQELQSAPAQAGQSWTVHWQQGIHSFVVVLLS